ncbi:MAG: DUF2760 domain-containing protein [Planctomycetales bacterium]|nr:DUF2760 domain-containing protein [Planctomycetales bacterium]
MRIGLAFRAFFQALFNRQAAEAVAAALDARALPAPSATTTPAESAAAPAKPTPAKPQPPKPAPPARSDALTLLAALQRESRLIDIVKEPLANYSDAQIGAAARDVLRDCGNVLERMFALRPVEEGEEGTSIEIPPGFDAARFRLTGNVQGEPPFRGSLAHHGWQATKCEVPQWSGNEASARIVAPAEVELS